MVTDSSNYFPSNFNLLILDLSQFSWKGFMYSKQGLMLKTSTTYKTRTAMSETYSSSKLSDILCLYISVSHLFDQTHCVVFVSKVPTLTKRVLQRN